MEATSLSNFPILKTNRLILRKISINDFTELKEIANFSEKKRNDEEVREMLETLDKTYLENTGITWGMYKEEELIGSCGYYRGFENNTGEIGFVLRQAYWGMDFMREACVAVMNYGYKELGLKTITAFTKDDNSNTIRFLGKLGFERTEEFSTVYRKYILQKR